MKEASYEFLKKLLSIPGPSGNEGAAASAWRAEAEKFAEVRGDRMGNSFATLNGGGTPKVMLSGHIDEIGLMITHINDEGLLRFQGVGGWDSQVLVGQRVLIQTKDGAVDFNQGITYYNTLRQLGKDVILLEYVGENHGLQRPVNQKDYAVRMREWFDAYLKGAPAPDWMKNGVPRLQMAEHLRMRADTTGAKPDVVP